MARKRYNLPARALEQPMAWIKNEILETGLSSLEIERASGVPASTIRSALNGRNGAFSCKAWAELTLWLKFR